LALAAPSAVAVAPVVTKEPLCQRIPELLSFTASIKPWVSPATSPASPATNR